MVASFKYLQNNSYFVCHKFALQRGVWGLMIFYS